MIVTSFSEYLFQANSSKCTYHALESLLSEVIFSENAQANLSSLDVSSSIMFMMLLFFLYLLLILQFFYKITNQL